MPPYQHTTPLVLYAPRTASGPRVTGTGTGTGHRVPAALPGVALFEVKCEVKSEMKSEVKSEVKWSGVA